ncbi:MAG: chemotaxis protein CheX [Granulosicoccus sp.]
MSAITEEDLHEVLEVVCMTVFDLSVEPASASDFLSDEPLICKIAISGAWNGTVLIKAGINFLNCAASHMFNLNLTDVESMDRVDAFTELNNMLGGSVKCLLPEPSDLSLPQIVAAESVKCEQSWFYFLCGDNPLAIAVTEMLSGDKKAA